MRWAAGVLIAVCACGGKPGSGGGPPGGGTNSNGSPDAGPPDAGPADGGADGGPSADCIGIVPSSIGTSLTFDVPIAPGKACAAASGDGDGMMVAESHDGGVSPGPSDPVTWNVFNTRGAWQGNFAGGAAIFPQTSGYQGSASGYATTWNPYGAPMAFVAVEPGAVLAPGLSGGTIAIGAASGSVVLHRIDAAGNETATLKTAAAGAPWAGAQDQGGAILAVVQSGGIARGIWFDLAHGTAGAPFDLGPASRDALARPLSGGGIAVRLDGHWTATVNPVEPALHPAPAWLADGTDFSIARGGMAYAVLQGGNVVQLVSIQGASCGSVSFSGVSSVSLGADGTVIGASGATGCTKIFWRNALR